MRLGTAWLLLASVTSLGAQAQGSVGGEVVAAETLAPLPYSTVALLPRYTARFANDSGAFLFRELPTGTYRLMVRQIGYVPVDTVLVVGAMPVALRIELRRLALELPPVTVVGIASCRNPGPPDPRTSPELALIFDELRENAARYRLLADTYPFRFWTERVLSDEDAKGNVRVLSVDTVELASYGRWRYAPGRLVVASVGPRERGREMKIPTLPDLADTAFHAAHCFAFGGLEAFEGRELARVDFQAATRIETPDVDGTALLDPATYQLRRLTLRLTHPGRAARGMAGLEAVVTFQELIPSVIVPAQISGTTTLAGRRRTAPPRVYERQRLVRVEFLRTPPGQQ